MNYLQVITNAPDKGAVAQANFEKLDTEILRGTGDLDFGSIAAQSKADLTITVTGAAVGDPVFFGVFAIPPTGIVLQAFVSATDTVTIRATNVTSSPIDPDSANYKVLVLRY